MIKPDPIFHRAMCDGCPKVSSILSVSASKARGDVLNLSHSPVGRPWVEIDGKLYCDDCGVRILGTEGYFAATDKRIAETHVAVTAK